MSPASHRRQRQQASELAARLMREHGLALAPARDKAVRQLGLPLQPGHPAHPGRSEIEQALAAQLRLFAPAGQAGQLAGKRAAAMEAMAFLAAFAPRLAGGVLDGSAQGHDPVVLHLHADAPEDAALLLHELPQPPRPGSARVRLPDGPLTVPCWALNVDGIDFQLLVLPRSALQHGPRHPADGSPLPRASLAQLRLLQG